MNTHPKPLHIGVQCHSQSLSDQSLDRKGPVDRHTAYSIQYSSVSCHVMSCLV